MLQFNHSVFDSFPVLKTPRLTLRDIRIEDARQIFAMRANGRVNQFIARQAMQQQEAAETLVEKTINAYKQKTAIGWAGILRDNKEIIGTCGFNSIDIPNLHAEIGGELDINYWGKNIAMEAITAIINFGLQQMNLHTIEAKVSPMNRGAVFLLEQSGFVKEAHYKERICFENKFSDMVVYTLHNSAH